ncbi:Hypothetical protein CINCED_3A002737 [Cinara cedri]|uniref:Uncharacterized protein n=1 Tax=Cinara cedri TaxID=506608 RepID=A0A5E4MFZ8_9HEMI|nr:Hypothetical protein CINCED_3A002737 [Cinara cedri]
MAQDVLINESRDNVIAATIITSPAAGRLAHIPRITTVVFHPAPQAAPRIRRSIAVRIAPTTSRFVLLRNVRRYTFPGPYSWVSVSISSSLARGYDGACPIRLARRPGFSEEDSPIQRVSANLARELP